MNGYEHIIEFAGIIEKCDGVMSFHYDKASTPPLKIWMFEQDFLEEFPEHHKDTGYHLGSPFVRRFVKKDSVEICCVSLKR